MWSLLARINKHLTVAIPMMMLTGFITGYKIDATGLKQLILPFTFLMVYPMMVNLKIRKILERGDFKAQIVAQTINFAIIPFVAYAIGLLFFSDHPYLALGLLLAGLVPTSGMTISWTGFAGGNLEAAIKMTVIGLILGSILTPFYLQGLLGATIELKLFGIFKQIILIVFLPMLAGWVTQRLCIHRYGQNTFQSVIGPRFPPLSTIGVLGIVFIAMALKARSIAAQPDLLFAIIVPLVLLYSFNYLFSSIIGKIALNGGDATALVYGTVMRNLSIALAIAINAFGTAGPDAALVIAVAYIIQVQSAAWFVKLAKILFGSAEQFKGQNRGEN